jgi:serine protease AprX
MRNQLTRHVSPGTRLPGELVITLLCAAATLAAQNPKLAPDLADLDSSEPVDVIIQLEDTPASRPGAPRPARPLALGGVNLASQRPVRELGLINGLTARVPAASLASLAADPRVKYISPDRPVTASTQNAIPAINAKAAQAAGFDGKGIGIAVIDSGINTHIDFRDDSCGITTNRIVFQQNFAPPDAAYSAVGTTVGPGTPRPDLYGHGTHVAGVLAGNGKCSGENSGGGLGGRLEENAVDRSI